MCIIDKAVEKHEKEEQEQVQEALRQRLEILFVKLSGITENNVYVSELAALGATPHLDECKRYSKDGGNAYVSTCLGAAIDVAEYLAAQSIGGILDHGNVPDTHFPLYYFVCKV